MSDLVSCVRYHQDHLVKQGMKADLASPLVELTATRCSTVKYDVELAEEYIARQVTLGKHCALSQRVAFSIGVSVDHMSLGRGQISAFSAVDPSAILPLHQVLSLQAIYTLDAVISKVQVSLDDHLSKVAMETDANQSSQVTKNLLPATLQLIDVYTAFTR